jgi:Glutamine amidotransferase domain
VCKCAMISKITDKNREDCWVFLQLLGQLMSPGNNDGLGYAAVDKAGKLFGEKWLINESAFKDLYQIKDMNSEKMAKIYSFFGDKVNRDEVQSVILHTRAATCTKNIQNTHPFVDDESNPSVAIIHNGLVHNEKKFTRKYSTCDSEVLAHLYQENKVADDLENLNKFLKLIDGWYTVLALSKEPTGRLIMDAFTDNGRLGSYFIKELDTRVWSSNSVDVLQIARALGLTPIEELKMMSDTAMRIDVLTGEQIAHIKLETANRVPVRVYPTPNWEQWENVSVMEGNLDDEEFRNRYFRGWVGYHLGD